MSEQLKTPEQAVRKRTPWLVMGGVLGVATLATVIVLVVSFFAPKPEPLFTLAASGGQESAEMSSDMRMGVWATYEYLAGEELSSESSPGSVYQLVMQGDPIDVASSVAQQFGVQGEVQQSQYFDENYPTYVVGPEDWTGPSVSVTWTGTGSWFYSNPSAYPEPICTEAPAPEGFEEPYYECENPEPEGPLPTAEEARSQAAELFQANGLEVTPDQVRVLSEDEWGVGVSASLFVEGVETAIEWSVYWAPGPVIASASGHSVSVVDRGDFDTVSPKDAVSRLDSGAWWGAVGPSYYLAPIARSAETLEGDVGADVIEPEAPSGEEGAGDVIEPAPLPEEEYPAVPEEPEVIQVTVTSAERTMLVVWDASGNAWIVPGYVMRYSEDDWGWTSVIALIEGVIEVPEPMPVDIMPMPEPYVD